MRKSILTVTATFTICLLLFLPARATAQSGLSLALDGVNDYASVADNDSLDLGTLDGQGFTIEAWFYVPDLNGEGLQTLIYKQSAYALFINFRTNQSDQLFFRLWSPALLSPGYITLFPTASSLSIGWHHAAAVFDNQSGPNDTGAIYLDGSRIGFGSGLSFSPGIGNSSSALNIGAYLGVNPFHGWIDEVRLSNVARYSGASYAPPSGAFATDANTRALWHFNEAFNSTGFVDDSTYRNTLTGINGAKTANATGGDTTPPTIQSITRLTPSGQLTSAASVVYRVNFSEHVNNVSTADFTLVKVTGTITGESITAINASSGTTIDVTASTGTGDGTMRLDVLAGVATITDAADNSLNQNFTSGEAYSIDRTAPVANSLSPSDGAVGVALDTHLVITFSEPSVKGVGNIVIRKLSDDTLFETIAVTSAQVTISNNLATIDPSSSFGTEMSYYVQIDSGAFDDLAGNDYLGISDNTIWNFNTAAAAPPTVVNVSPSVVGGTLPEGATSIQITFSEPVLGGDLAANYQLRGLGPDALLGTQDDVMVPVNVSYAGNVATLGFSALDASVYRLTTRDAITNTFGVALDGDRDGNAGADYVGDFVVFATAPSRFDPRIELSRDTSSPLTCAVADLDSDGREDLVLAIYSQGSVGVRRGLGGGAFSETVLYSSGGGYPEHLGIADFNGDGERDIAVINQNSGTLGVLLGRGNATFDGPSIYSLDSGGHRGPFAVGDFNGDGRDDIAIMQYSGNAAIRILLGQSDGTLSIASRYEIGSRSVATGDFDGDGNLDLVADNWMTGDVSLLTGRGDGTFFLRGTYGSGAPYPTFVTSGDLNGDMQLDLVVTHGYSDILAVLTGNGDGTLNNPVTYSQGGFYDNTAVISDVDKDGRQDVALALSGSGDGGLMGYVALLLGQPDGNLGDAITYSLEWDHASWLSIGDFDLDGRRDLAVLKHENGFGAAMEIWIQTPKNNVEMFITPLGYSLDVLLTSLMSGQLVQGPDNAFDGLNRLQVSGANYAPTANSATHDDDRTVVTGTHNLTGLNVHREVTVPASGNEDFARTIDVFQNPTGAAITTTVRIVGNLGSDAATTVFATSDGDTVVETGDQWIGTDDGNGNGTPAIVHYIHGPAGLEPTSVIITGDNIEWTYQLTVSAGQTARLAHFTILAQYRADAIAAANAIVTLSGFGGQATAFLTQDELDSLANFGFDLGGVPAIDVTWESAASSFKHNSATAGWEFTVLSPIRVTKLGVFDFAQDGFAESHQTGIWSTNGTLLVQTNLASGTGAELIDGFRYLPITETLLQPGHYIIGTFFRHAGPDKILDTPSPAIVAPQIAFYQARYGAETFTFPNVGQGVGNGTNTFGPNFRFVEAEPSVAVSLTTTQVLLSWPSSSAVFRLEATANLSPPIHWSSVTNSPTLIGGQYQLTLPRTNGSQFFRLVNP